MKKLGRAIFLVGLMLIFFTVLFVACNTNSTDNNQVQNGNQQSDANNDTNGQFIVTVHPNNGNSTFKWTIASDIPSIEREGYYFDGIYLDSTFMSATSFESLKKTGIKSNLDVYVKWASHKHEFGSWHILIKPTHISEGLRVWYCSLCDAEKYETMPKVGEHVFSLVWTIDIESTTTTDGEKSHHCTILGCTERKDITTIPKKDSDGSSTPVGHEHNMALLEKVPATCTVEGYEINKCEECDYVKRTTLPVVSNTIDHRELLAGEKCTKCGYTSISNLRDSVLMYNTSYDTYCAEYYGTIVEKDIFEYYNQRINLAYLSDTIETIARDSFKDWISLDHIILPNTIRKIEENAFYGCSLLNAVSIPDSVEEIEESAFAQCIDLERVEMSQSLKHIGRNVLYGTKWFNEQTEGQVYLGNVAIAIKQGCNKIDEIKPGTRIVADGFFADQSELSIITIPSSILYFGEKVFENCANITGVIYNAVNAECKDNLFKNRTSIENVVFGNDVENIPDGLFENCSSIKDVTFVGENISEIGSNAFTNCSAIKDIVIPTGVTSIGDGAFDGCALLSRIEIPDSVTNIGVGAFNGCSSLESITIPFVGASKTANNGYNQVFGYIFGYETTTSSSSTLSGAILQYSEDSSYYWYYIPSSLEHVVISGGASTIPSYAFYNCSGLTSIALPDSVTSIGGDAFKGCTGLTSTYYTGDVASWCGISGLGNLMSYGSSTKTLYFDENKVEGELIIPDSVTSIPSSAFRGCTGLTSITIGNSVTSIGGYAFSGCTGLTSITIPDSVTSIGEGALEGCSSLESITIPFVGANDNTSSTYYRVFGYIFGCTTTSSSSSTVDGAIMQHYTYYSYSKKYIYYWYYIPSSLKSVVIGDGATSIPYHAFYNCRGLTSITIGSDVTTIVNEAFYNCMGLTSVYYKGTKSKWNNISIGNGNSYLTSATRYYYSETEPPLNSDGTAYDDNYWHYDTDGKTIVIWKKANEEG